MDTNLSNFIEELKTAYTNNLLKKIILSKPASNDEPIKRIQGRIVEIKQEKKISFVFEYQTKNITKNFSMEDCEKQLTELLGNNFKNAMLFTEQHDIRLSYNKKMKSNLAYSKPTLLENISLEHNKEKNSIISINNNIYLKELGVITQENKIAQNMQSKLKQINKYIETIEGVIKSSNLMTEKEIDIVDMGSGKGYLTFATYDFLTQALKIKANITGVEIREELVDLCNTITKKCDYKNLSFYKGDIKSFSSTKTDILIALHACDTATDDAIYKGITSNASIIITAPCCHKQIRKELNVTNGLKEITKHGILKERQAEIITDTLRGLVLESFGYKTQIFEFIADAHTHKNVMIVGVKKEKQVKKDDFIKRINDLKKMFGIKEFYLENLLRDDIQKEKTN